MNSNNKVCNNCGKILTSDAKFCSGCGKAITEDKHNNIVNSTKKCDNCGKEVISNDARFCRYCGNKLNDNQTTTVFVPEFKSYSNKKDNIEDVKKNIVITYLAICLISAIVFITTSVSLASGIQGDGDVEKQLSIFSIMSAPLMYIFSSIFVIAIIKNKGFLTFLAIAFGIASSIIMAILGGDIVGFFIEILFFVALFCMMFPCYIIADEYNGNMVKKIRGMFIYSIVITTIFSVISIMFPIPVLAILLLLIIITIFSGGKAQKGIILIFIK